ncbi:MarR family winged helix-turn-helix transcriptional regulator [Novosphingobium mathurense]|uniref:Transcriptional regulator, MarR family n=2 Tax=Novosphingobium TaxID=165696 RepID=A0A1U6HV41_9SPHN|nr:helix-turn-helix domain-containing protein [Novosphingobium mathurense]CDO35116.1 conserved hypothetical protein [Novosphingobium sp. KN65.2]SLJ99618.1 transcriptional regulator, MarR family [Novosphingobium mathurense]
MADGFLMMDLLRSFYWFDEALQSGLKSHGWPDVSRGQSLVLVNIMLGVRRASQLARNLGISRQAMSKTLVEMEERGLIVLKPDPMDRRAQIVAFSPESETLRDDAQAILRELEGHIGRRFGKQRIARMREILREDWGAIPDLSSVNRD